MQKIKKTNGLDLMLDTVSLKLKHSEFRVVKPEMFSPDLIIRRKEEIPTNLPLKGLYKKYTQNPTREDKENEIYKPCLDVYRRFEEGELNYYLHIRFSAPKLLFANNLRELWNGNFPSVVRLLKERLWTMGIEVSEEVLRNACVNCIHFSKNIILPYPFTVTEVLRELTKTYMGERVEVNLREYRNGGESLHIYTTVHNSIFYDKMKDIGKTKNISVDKDKTKTERSIVQDKLRQGEQVLRFEDRLNGQKFVTSFVSKVLGKKVERVSFEMIFNEELCKKALKRRWADIASRPENQLAFKMDISHEDVLNAFILKARSKKADAHSLNKVLTSFGLYRLINEFGLKAMKDKFLTNWSEKACGQRLNDKIAESAVMLKDVPLCRPISLIERGLEEFNRYGPERASPYDA